MNDVFIIIDDTHSKVNVEEREISIRNLKTVTESQERLEELSKCNDDYLCLIYC